MLGHPPFEFNLWIPFTKVYSTNSMRLMPYKESIKLMEFCNNDFELFAKKTQYDENFRNKLKQESSPLDMNYGILLFLTQDVCIVRSTMIQKILE